ncbi:transferase [Sporodiniella umbellata]|nr:transferase [Sporodiniella umbellata]
MAPISRIQVISTSWIKPESSNPFHREHTQLSDWDAVMYTSYTPLLLFYTNINRDPRFMSTEVLKASLSKTLTEFYPLAGRLLDVGNGRDVINNCDGGILFVEAEYPKDLESFRENGYVPSQMDYHKMFPIHFYCSPQDPLVAVQITRFSDDGVALGIMMLQKIADTYSFCYFLDAWSKAARDVDFTPAIFSRALVQCPEDAPITEEALERYRDEHQTSASQLSKPDPSTTFNRNGAKGPKPLKSIILEFDSKGLQDCKKEAHTQEMIKNKDWVSTKDALFAMLLRAVVRSRDVSANTELKAVMPVNGRTKMKNQKGIDYYFGNWTISQTFKTSFKEIKRTSLVDTALKFREVTIGLSPSLFHGISKLYQLHEDMSINYLTYQPNSESQTTINDVSLLPFCKLDFGFGQPDRTRGYITFGGNGCFTVFGRGDDNGAVYDVQLQMDVESISRLIEDPDIQKYAMNIIY